MALRRHDAMAAVATHLSDENWNVKFHAWPERKDGVIQASKDGWKLKVEFENWGTCAYLLSYGMLGTTYDLSDSWRRSGWRITFYSEVNYHQFKEDFAKLLKEAQSDLLKVVAKQILEKSELAEKTA